MVGLVHRETVEWVGRRVALRSPHTVLAEHVEAVIVNTLTESRSAPRLVDEGPHLIVEDVAAHRQSDLEGVRSQTVADRLVHVSTDHCLWTVRRPTSFSGMKLVRGSPNPPTNGCAKASVATSKSLVHPPLGPDRERQTPRLRLAKRDTRQPRPRLLKNLGIGHYFRPLGLCPEVLGPTATP